MLLAFPKPLTYDYNAFASTNAFSLIRYDPYVLTSFRAKGSEKTNKDAVPGRTSPSVITRVIYPLTRISNSSTLSPLGIVRGIGTTLPFCLGIKFQDSMACKEFLLPKRFFFVLSIIYKFIPFIYYFFPSIWINNLSIIDITSIYIKISSINYSIRHTSLSLYKHFILIEFSLFNQSTIIFPLSFSQNIMISPILKFTCPFT